MLSREAQEAYFTLFAIQKYCPANRYQDHLSIQNIQLFSGTRDAQIISLNIAVFTDWLLAYYKF